MKLVFGKLHLGGIAGKFEYAKPRGKKAMDVSGYVRPWFDGMLSSAVILEPGYLCSPRVGCTVAHHMVGCVATTHMSTL